ncbi:MAG: Fic family protein [Pseudomonadota bacterium]
MTVWQEIAEKKAALDRLRPLTPRSLAALDAWYDVELTYTSNALEGNTLTRSETALVLEKGLTVRGKRLSDHLEIVDHKEALDYVRLLAAQDGPIREGDVKAIHALVLARSNKEEAGRYSRYQRFIQGSNVQFPPPLEVPALMEAFGQWLAGLDLSPQNAFEAHARLVSIHPFTDGNGRTARLFMNLLLIKGGYPPVVILPEDKPDYIDALESRQSGGDGAAFDAFMARRLSASLDAYLRTASNELAARTGAEGQQDP